MIFAEYKISCEGYVVSGKLHDGSLSFSFEYDEQAKCVYWEAYREWDDKEENGSYKAKNFKPYDSKQIRKVINKIDLAFK